MLDYRVFLAGLGLLTANYPSRSGSADDPDALLAAWWLVLHGKDETDSRGVTATIGGKPWITDAVFQRGVSECLVSVKDWLPPVGEFVAICEYAKGLIEQETAPPALPAPTWRVVSKAAAEDPYSCTPEERERWAREDVWLRGYAKMIAGTETPAAVQDRLSAEDRRAKEQRIARERLAAFEQIMKSLRLPADRQPRPFGIPGKPQPIVWDTTRLDRLRADRDEALEAEIAR